MSVQVKQKYACCVQALKDYVAEAGFEEVVVGLSGGIDSAVTATMCVDAFGPDHVLGVLLPGPYSSEHSVTDALALAEALGIETEQVSITGAYQAFAQALEPVCGAAFQGLPAENTQARCRMVVLMAISNATRRLLINTGNKSEAMMGYSTLYGDTAGAFAPLGGLYKTDVYTVGKWRNACAPEDLAGIAKDAHLAPVTPPAHAPATPSAQVADMPLASDGVAPSNTAAASTRAAALCPIPENTFTKPPSAELSPGQEDEKSLGIDYAMLDAILISLFEHNLPIEETAALVGTPASEVQRIKDRAESWAFKRALEPPFPQNRFYDE